MANNRHVGGLVSVRDKYLELFGRVPEGIERRIELAKRFDRSSDIDVIEALRESMIKNNILDPRTQQLVHFAMLIATGDIGPAKLHAQGALKAGASLDDLYGVAQTAVIVCGMPGFSRAVEILHPLGSTQ